MDTLFQLFSIVLAVLLAFSPGVKHAVERIGPAPSETEITETPDNRAFIGDLLDSFDTLVRDALRGDERYQQAAVIGSTASPSPATALDEALVNIFCTAHIGGTSKIVTGSGVFISEEGVILTNAHIAQLLLLGETDPESNAQCIVRQGSPALSKYRADLLYISPSWIKENADQLYAEDPSGTGENDFALLYVTTAFEEEIPKSFPALPLLSAPSVFEDMPLTAAGYPAETLATLGAPGPLVPVVATTSVTRLFTFGEKNDVDLFGLAPSTLGHHGSSGGPVADEAGRLVGLIVTRGNTANEGERSLRALALAYIDRTLRKESGLALAETLLGDIALRAKTFRDTVAPPLQKALAGGE